jgi:predicted phage terminase large subunit-like protein
MTAKQAFASRLKQSSAARARSLRVEWFKYDIEGFCRYYLPHAFTAPIADVHRELLTLSGDCVEEIFRGGGKSTCLGAVILHSILYEWRKFVLVASWTIEQSSEFVRRTRDELAHNERIIEDFGPQIGNKWTERGFTTRNGATVRAVGVRKGVRGAVSSYERPDLLVVDDIEDDERVQTVEQRDKLYRRLTTAFFNLGSNVSRDLWVWVIGTPLHRDCVLRRLKADGWKYRRVPATKDGTPAGEPEWPAFGTDKIHERIRKVGSRAARQELFLDPLDEGEAAYELEWFRYYNDDRHIAEGWDTYVYVDPAIGQKKESDWFVLTVVASSPIGHEPQIRVLEQITRKLSVGQQVRLISEYWKRYDPVSIGVEANAYQDSLRQQLTEHCSRVDGMRPPVVPVYSSRAKELRIRDASPLVEFGEVLFNADTQKELIQHLCDWPSVAHDDMADSFAGALKLVRRTGRMMA